MAQQKIHMEFNEPDKIFLAHRFEFTWAEFIMFLLICGLATFLLRFLPVSLILRIVIAALIILIGFAFVYIRPFNRSMLKWAGDGVKYSLETKARVWTKTDDFPSTQVDLGFKKIMDSVCLTETGSYTALLELQGLHVATMSFDEKESLFYRYTQFLNTLTFPVQMLVRLRRISFEGYLGSLEERVRNVSDNIFTLQYLVYLGDFITEKTANRNLISRQYYLVVPYIPNPITMGIKSTKGFWSAIKNLFFPTAASLGSGSELLDDEAKKALYDRCNLIMRSLTRVGLRSRRLNSDEIKAVFYATNNPRLSEQQPWRIDGILSEAFFPHHAAELEQGEEFFSNRTEFQPGGAEETLEDEPKAPTQSGHYI